MLRIFKVRISKYFSYSILFTILLYLGSTDLKAQKIDNIIVTSTTVCAGEKITVQFEVENGNNDQFTATGTTTTGTEYTIDFGTVPVKDFAPNGVTLNFFSDTAPPSGNKNTATITQDFLIPEDTPAGTNYQFRVGSTNPNAGGSKKEVTGLFEVYAKPATPVVSNNGPICSRETLSLFAENNETNVSYNWTGPNGFKSTDQNPVINNTSANMSGDYTVSVINITTGCISNPVTQTILIKGENLWNGSIDNDWNNINNWDCDRIPDLNEIVRIPGTGISNYPILQSGSSGQCQDIIIENMASLTVSNNALQISGSITNDGTFEADKGTIEMVGGASQTIPNAAFLNNRIKNLTINNNSGVNLTGDLEITGTLLAENGNLKSNGFLKLISDVTQTALIDGSGNGSVIGDVTMQRYIDPAFGYKYISSPFENSTVGDLASYVDLNATFPLFYEYNENREDTNGDDITGWSPYTGSTSALNVMEGYAINMGETTTSATVELTGTVNNSSYNSTLANNDGTYTKGFHLVGNPYPSPIDWNASSGWTRNGIDDAIYLFSANASDQFTGSYSSYVNDISSAGSGTGIIASMQGFFVHVTNSTGGNFGMNNSVRINDFNNHEFIRSQASTTPLIRISAGFENTSLDDPMVIYFDSYASLNFESELDALKLMNTDKNVPSLYSISDDKEKLLSINAVPDPISKSYHRIPLGITTERDGNIIFSLKDFENIPENLNVFLIDQKRKASINLKKVDYKIFVSKGKFNSRFLLSFSSLENLSPENIIEAPFILKSGNQKISVKMNLLEDIHGTLRISTVNGKLIDLIQVKDDMEITIDGIKSNGVYLVTFISGNKQYTKKVIVRK